MSKDEDAKILPFPGKKLDSSKPTILGCDEYGVPNIPQAHVYGLMILSRGKVMGTLLFSSAEKRDYANKVYTQVVKDQKMQAEIKYETVYYPVF